MGCLLAHRAGTSFNFCYNELVATSLSDPDFISFLLRAKQNTYAAGDSGQVESSRKASHDLAYCEGDWSYLDTYLGGLAFIGEEAVWKNEIPIWGMNYYGMMTVPEAPEGFTKFHKDALMQIPAEAPYRGPAEFSRGGFHYACQWEGDPARFSGNESISFDGQVIYVLTFHGGMVV